MSRQSKVFNDPIHGHVELHPLLIKFIDTPQFQRLRHIKQLGGAYFVYPGASHNRFEHSIGVGHLAGELAKALIRRQPELYSRKEDIDRDKEIDRDILCVQIAGLCHDLGHGPFSHMFDKKFIANKRPDLEWKHEKASVEMFDHMVKENDLEKEMEDHGLIPENDMTFIKEMISPIENTEPWPYEGRTKDKSFLYEIVANKVTGIDVDKFDYLARDCYHLGIQNNFDYHRFLKFAKVCEVDERRHICTRDKEVGNLYDLFHTRYCLHRRACQHKTNTIIETMIGEAFLKADEHLTFEGKVGPDGKKKKLILSKTIDDMVAYTKVTDLVFEQILHDPRPEMDEARKILEAIISRKHYKLLGEIRPQDPIEPIQKKMSELKDALAKATRGKLTAEDFKVVVNTMNYGSKEDDPISKMHFYSKENPGTALSITKDQVSRLLPNCFSEELVRVYIKSNADDAREAARKRLVEWCQEKKWPAPQYGDIPLRDSE